MPTVVMVPVTRGEAANPRPSNSIESHLKMDSLHRKLGDVPFCKKKTPVDENPAIFDIWLITS